MTINNIVFFCPSRLTGGHEYLSVRLADYLLVSQSQYSIYYCDYPDGFSHTRWHSDKVKYIDYYGADIPVDIPTNSIVIAQLNLISQLERFQIDRTNSLVIYWYLHSLNIKGQISWRNHYFITKSEKKRLGDELRYLAENNIIKLSSYGAYAELIKDFYQEPMLLSWLPNIAPIKPNQHEPIFSRISNDEIKFCWLGRLDEEKARNILTYMNELEEVNKVHKLSLSLIGKGPAEDMLKQESLKYSYPITFVGEKRDDDLDMFILNDTEIGLASGTSAYEFSLRGKPVIMEWVIDKVYPAGVRDQYIFTDEEEKYDFSSGFELKKEGSSTFENKLEKILADYSKISMQGYDFVMGKSAENCAQMLIKNIHYLEGIQSTQSFFTHIKYASNIINKGNRRLNLYIKLRSIIGLKN